MSEGYKTVLTGGTGEIVEKKSRFIATVRPVKTEADILTFLEETKKKYWDARHNCSAYTLGLNRELTRCSDDGEPSGTAGRPMLDVLLGAGLYNTAVIVTRYFGGVLLGTGGLVRAYSDAVRAGLAASVIAEKIRGISLKVTTDYTGIGKLQYLAGERDIPILDTQYTDKVVAFLLVSHSQEGELKNALTEKFNGRILMEKEKDLYFALVNGKPKVFED